MITSKGTITRRMDYILDDLKDEFKSLCGIEDFENKLYELEQAGNRSDRPSKLKDLYYLFDCCDIYYEKDKDIAYYKELVRKADIPDFNELETKMLLAIYKIFKNYPSPEEYMQRIVSRLSSNPEWANDTLRLRILKQFIKYGDCLKDAGYGGKMAISNYVKEKIGKKPSPDEILANLDDNVFELLNNSNKAQKKPEGKHGLLKAADDLATGKFRAEGATKKLLYLFAMVYDMSFFSPAIAGSVPFDSEKDIETNLFRDYYANNLMRFITDYYQNNLSEFELDPSGQGINYKNFAEIIYLYFISQDFSPQDKIRLSCEMIRRVQAKQKGAGTPIIPSANETVYYRNLFGNTNHLFTEDILNLSVNDFEDYICNNYDCNTEKETHIMGAFQLETEQNSAFREYELILQDLSDLAVDLEDCSYGLWFTDVSSLSPDLLGSSNKDQFTNFINLLEGINSFMMGSSNRGALEISSPSSITRTSIIVAFYYYYNALHEDEDNSKWKSFEEVFKDFKRNVDERLEASYYQPLSGKNIFDVLVVFSSYAYLNY